MNKIEQQASGLVKSPAFRFALLVEDEVSLGLAMGEALKRIGIEFVLAQSLQDARNLFRQHGQNVDLVLLDRKLPDGEGVLFCEELRAKGFSGGVIILSAFGEIEDRVFGLERGADDYLPKPFSWQELEARLVALARRLSRAPRDTGPTSLSPSNLWEIKRDQQQVFGQKGWVKLTPIEFKFCEKLMTNPGRILTREELLKEVWGYQWLPKTRTVDFFLGRLRKILEIDPDNPKHFTTVRGVGVRFDP